MHPSGNRHDAADFALVLTVRHSERRENETHVLLLYFPIIPEYVSLGFLLVEYLWSRNIVSFSISQIVW